MELIVLNLPPDFDLATFYARQGHTVLKGRKHAQKPRSRLSGTLLTCVNVTKRLLGIEAYWIWTPWQLFSLLAKRPPAGSPWQMIAPKIDQGKFSD